MLSCGVWEELVEGMEVSGVCVVGVLSRGMVLEVVG